MNSSEMRNIIYSILTQFGLTGDLTKTELLSGGWINTTLRAVVRQSGGSTHTYVVQRINTAVFSDPAALMENICRVTAHIRSVGGRTLHFYSSADGKHCVQDEHGAWWRVMDLIETRPPETDPIHTAYAVGAAFGAFTRQLSGLNASALHETIPGFHDTPARLDSFFSHLSADPLGRAGKIRAEAAYLTAVRAEASQLCALYADGAFLPRVTHNDTKASNVLFARDTGARIVIDLDTVMPGMVMYDFGDGVRSAAMTDGRVDRKKFLSYCEGFLSQCAAVLTAAERDRLIQGAFSVTLELAARYLDDYLTGDRYFAPHSSTENLRRARLLLSAAQDLYMQRDALCADVRFLSEQYCFK